LSSIAPRSTCGAAELTADALGAIAFAVPTAAFDGAVEPAALARKPTSGTANAAIANTSTTIKPALFMFIFYPSPCFSERPVICAFYSTSLDTKAPGITVIA
jgi:hypothetical protein